MTAPRHAGRSFTSVLAVASASTGAAAGPIQLEESP
jgi:hypothetical protein